MALVNLPQVVNFISGVVITVIALAKSLSERVSVLDTIIYGKTQDTTAAGVTQTALFALATSILVLLLAITS